MVCYKRNNMNTLVSLMKIAKNMVMERLRTRIKILRMKGTGTKT